MPGAYNVVLRTKAIEAVNKNELGKGEIARAFGIDQKTLFNWRKQQKATGNVNPIKPRGRPSKIIDSEKFKNFILENPNSTLKQLAHKWGGVSSETIRKTLHRLNYSFKKNSFCIKKETKNSELNL
jgi:transposase